MLSRSRDIFFVEVRATYEKALNPERFPETGPWGGVNPPPP
jgi:hypothetical protein